MFLFRWLEWAMNCFFAILVIAFVIGLLSFGDKQTMGIRTVLNSIETSFLVGYQACELTGFCGGSDMKN